MNLNLQQMTGVAAQNALNDPANATKVLALILGANVAMYGIDKLCELVHEVSINGDCDVAFDFKALKCMITKHKEK